MDASERKLAISNLVNLLFETIKKDNGNQYSTPEAALLMELTESTLRAVRNGVVGSPGIHTLIPIAHFFNVSLDYFDTKTDEEALAYISQSRGIIPKVERWAFRMSRLPESAQQDLLRIADWMEQAEELRRKGGNLEDLQDQGVVTIKPDSTI